MGGGGRDALILGSKCFPTLLVSSWGCGLDTIPSLSRPHMHTHSHPHSSPPWWLWAAGRGHWAGALLWFLSTHSAVSGPRRSRLREVSSPPLSSSSAAGAAQAPVDTITAARAWLHGGPETPPSPARPALPAQQPCWNTPFARPHPLLCWVLGPAFLSLTWSRVSTGLVLGAADV